MEVLQTSALPLGYGAGHRPAAHGRRRRYSNLVRSNKRHGFFYTADTGLYVGTDGDADRGGRFVE